MNLIIRNCFWDLFFWVVRVLPLRFSYWIYRKGWLGISKLAEVKRVPFEYIWQYIRDHGEFFVFF